MFHLHVISRKQAEENEEQGGAGDTPALKGVNLNSQQLALKDEQEALTA